MTDKKQLADHTESNLTRRQFIHRAGAAAATISVAKSSAGYGNSPNERIGVGFIGCGGRSNAHIKTVDYTEERVEALHKEALQAREELEKLKKMGHVDMWITDIKNM